MAWWIISRCQIARNNIIGQEAGCSAVFASKVGAGKFVDLSAHYGPTGGGDGSRQFTFEQFLQKSEVKTAQKILRSVSTKPRG
jgi:hypothetical protein